MLAGPGDVVAAAVRQRRILGGAMRQVGVFAAAALYALDHHLDRLVYDHAAARAVAEPLSAVPGVSVAPVETNIVVVDLPPTGPPAPDVVAAARDEGILILALGPRTVRAVAHRDVTEEQCAAAGKVLARIVAGEET